MSANLDQLVFKFFKLFAQYGSMINENGFFKSDKSGNVFVDWDRFAIEIVGKNLKTELGLGQSASAAEYILDQPPKR